MTKRHEDGTKTTRTHGDDRGEDEMHVVLAAYDADTSRKKGTAHVYSNPSYIAFSY